MVDNTFASPYLQQPLDLGADVVLHSVTKFINGHADVVGGIVVAKTEELDRRLRPLMIALGCNMDPHQAYLVHRGLKTLGLRIERAQASAHRDRRAGSRRAPRWRWVRYIGLPSHPQHELAKRQMSGFGTHDQLRAEGRPRGRARRDGPRAAGDAGRLAGRRRDPDRAPRLDDPRRHAPADRLEAGITDGLVRYSVGIEDVEDLIADLEQALAAIPAGSRG